MWGFLEGRKKVMVLGTEKTFSHLPSSDLIRSGTGGQCRGVDSCRGRNGGQLGASCLERAQAGTSSFWVAPQSPDSHTQEWGVRGGRAACISWSVYGVP